MIVLAQILKHPPDGWEDMRVPRDPDSLAVRGERPKITTVKQFASQLQSVGLVGEYRVVMNDGVIWRVSIVRTDVFVAVIEAETPV